MKRFLIPFVIGVGMMSSAQAADVDVSISIGHPGFYGVIDLNGIDRPPVMYSRPMLIQRGRRNTAIEPIYLRVPPRHAKSWRRYCGRYQACGRPVYFVRDDWYSNVYVPRYRDSHRVDRRNEHDDNRRDHNDRNDRNDRNDHNDRDDRSEHRNRDDNRR